MELSRREVLKAGVGLAAACAAPAIIRRAHAASRPNILFLMADQFRADCVGAGGNPVIRTPNLDRIANEGVRFTHAYSCTPTCTPARAALLSGLGPWRNGMLGYGRGAEKYPVEMPRALREAGYHTLGIGKMHWHPQRNDHGFHRLILDESSRAETPEFRSDYRGWFMSEAPHLDPDATGIGWNDYRSATYALPERLHPTRWMGDTAVNFLENYEQPEPFFLKVSFSRPHSPYDPPERFMKTYADAHLPKASVGAWAERYAERSGDDFTIWHGDLGAEQIRKSRQGYYGSVSFVDEQVGRILEVLDKRGVLDDTLILFTVDHGDMLGDHNLWRKSYAYEGSARIPMLMRGPSVARGQVRGEPVELRDVLPTFLHAATGSEPEGLDGRSMLRLDGWREWIDLEHDICYAPENHWSALTDGKTKYIFHTRDGEEQFFNLEKDPGETTDLAGDPSHAEALRTWRGRLIDHLSERGEKWVSGGKLALRPESHLYSPNNPGCSCHPKSDA